MLFTLTGHEAIAIAEAIGLTISMYTHPVDDARPGITPEVAREIAKEDPTLLYLEIEYIDLPHYHFRGNVDCEYEWDFLKALDPCLCPPGQSHLAQHNCPCLACYQWRQDIGL